MERVFGKGPERRLQAHTLAGALAQAAKEAAVSTLATTVYPNRYLVGLSEAEVVELTLAIGYWGMVARVLVALQVDVEPPYTQYLPDPT